MKLASLLIPVFNEQEILNSSLENLRVLKRLNDLDVYFIDNGSTDETVPKIESYIFHHKKDWKLLQAQFESPSVGKAVKYGLDFIQTEYTLILPIDCALSDQALENLIPCFRRGLKWGGFEKKYTSKSLFKSLYAKIQNSIRTRIFNNLVWTNCLFGRTKLLSSQIEVHGFLEDVILSDKLKKISNPYLIVDPVEVSDRKYHGQTLKRVLINLRILILYRLKLRSLTDLKKMYQ